MPVKINFIDDETGIEFISSGIVTGKEIIEANREVYSHEHLPRIRYKIVDRTNCTDYRVSSEDVRIIAEQDKEAAKVNPHIIFILISTTPLQYGVSRMWQAYVDQTGFETHLFADRASADAWLKERVESSGSRSEG